MILNIMNAVIRILKIAFYLVIAVPDVYVFTCTIVPQKCIVFRYSIVIENWLWIAIVKWIAILIYFLIKTNQKEMACQKVSETLACHEAELDNIREELDYLHENALIIDRKDR